MNYFVRSSSNSSSLRATALRVLFGALRVRRFAVRARGLLAQPPSLALGLALCIPGRAAFAAGLVTDGLNGPPLTGVTINGEVFPTNGVSIMPDACWGSTNYGVIYGNVSQWPALNPKVPSSRGACSFTNSALSYIQIPWSTDNWSTRFFTIEFWFSTTQTSGTPSTYWYNNIGLVDGDSGASVNDFGISLAAGHVQFGMGGTVAGDVYINSPNTYNDGNWHHVAASRNGDDGLMYLFVDGVLVASRTGVRLTTLSNPGPTFLHIGKVATSGSTATCFNGSLNEVRIWQSISMDQTLISNRMAQAISLSAPGLVGYYRMEGAVSSVAPDEGPSGLHARIYNPAGYSPAGVVAPSPNSNSGLFPQRTGRALLRKQTAGTYVQMPATNYFSGGPFTVEAWVRLHGHPGAGACLLDFGNGSMNDDVFLSFANAASYPYMGVYNGTAGDERAATNALALNQWINLAVTFDGATTVTIYTNGSIIGKWTNYTKKPAAIARSLCYVGRSIAGNGGTDTDLAEVRIWNIARSQADLAGSIGHAFTGKEAGLVAYWPLQGGPDLNMKLLEATPNHSDARVRHGGSLAAPANPGLAGSTAALQLDGGGSYAEAAVSWPTNTSFTVEAWTYSTGLQPNTVVVAKTVDATNPGDWVLGLDETGKVVFGTYAGTAMGRPIGSVTNQWHHLAGVYDATLAKVRLYLDGVLVQETNAIGPVGVNAQPVWIGNAFCPNIAWAGFQGLLDEVRIWNVVRDQASITNNMHALLTGGEPGLLAYWRMGEDASPTNDAGGNCIAGPIPERARADILPNKASYLFLPAQASAITATNAADTNQVTPSFIGIFQPSPGAPTALTGAASAMTTSNATLNAEFLPGNAPTTTWFQYGATTNYGQQTTPANLGSRALNLDGTDSYASLPAGQYFLGDYTIEAWVYLRSYQANCRLLDFAGAANGPESQAVALALNGDPAGGNPTAYLSHVGVLGTSSAVSSPTPLPLNQWVHLAATFTIGNSTAILYFNGSAVASNTTMLSYAVFAVTANNYIGRGNESWDRYADAMIEDLRIWNTPLSQGTLRAWMGKEVDASHPNYANLQQYFKFNDAAGATASDSAGSNESATLHGHASLTNATAFGSGPASAGILLTNSAPIHYRLVASNAFGLSYGADQTLTPPLPVYGYALQFDGSSGYLSSPVQGLGTNGSFTVEAWAYRTSRGPSPTGPVVAQTTTADHSGGGDWSLYFGGTGADVNFLTRFGAVASTALSPGSDTNGWHHLAGVLDGGAGKVRLYVDGRLAGESVTNGFPAHQGLLFDGITAYVETSTAVIPASGDFTVECWALCSVAPASYRELLSQGSSGSAFYLGIDLANNLRLGDSWSSTGVAVPIGGWHHFAVVKSSTNTICYVDGLVRSNRGYGIANPAGGTGLRFGRQYNVGLEPWAGGVADVRVWSRALSGAEVSATLNNQAAGSEAGLVAAWCFKEGTGATCTSVGPTPISGGLINGVTWSAPVWIGHDLANSFFQGLIDDVRIWNVPRSASDILADIQTRPGGGTPNLLAYWSMDDGFGLSAADGTANQFNGTLNGGVTWAPSTLARLPTLDAIADRSINSDAVTIPLSGIGTPDAVFPPLSVTAMTDSPGLLTNLAINYVAPSAAGTLSFRRVPYQSGTGIITVTVSNAVANRSRSFQVTVVNSAPIVGPATSLLFPGNGAYASLTNGVYFNGDFTIESWVYLRSNAAGSRLLDFGNGAGLDNVLFTPVGENGMPALHIYDSGGTSAHLVSTGGVLPTNRWVHLAATLSGTTGTLYVNGAPVGVNPSMIRPGNVIRTTNFIGRSNWAADPYADAAIADFRIWNVARSAAEIANCCQGTLTNNSPGLVAWYRFNEASGTTVFNSAGGGSATLVNGPQFWSPEGPATSLWFSGAQYVSAQTAGVTTNMFTVEAWVRPGTTTGTLGLFGSAPGDHAFDLEFQGGTTLQAHIGNGSVWSTNVGAVAFSYATSTWYHVACAVTPTNYSLYVDGSLRGSGRLELSPLFADGTHQPRLGTYQGTNYWKGGIGDVRVWNVVRAADEIAAFRFTRTLPASLPNLILYYTFSEGAGSTAVDWATVDGNQAATLINGPIWAANNTLATNQMGHYIENAPSPIFLPAFDIDTLLSVTNYAASASTGTVTSVTGQPGVYTYLSASNYNGLVAINYTVTDGQTPVSSQVLLQGLPVESPPTIDAIPDYTNDAVTAAGGYFLVPLTGLSCGDPELVASQPLSVTVSTDNPNLIRKSTVQYNWATDPYYTSGYLLLKTWPGSNGMARVTVRISDGGLTTSRTFAYIVKAMDLPPVAGNAAAVQFNGTNYITVSAANLGSLTSPGMPLKEVTVEFWQRANQATDAQSAVCSWPSNVVNYLGVTIPRADISALWSFGDVGGLLSYTPVVPITNTWHHFALVASYAGNCMKIYRDGVLEASRPGMVPFYPTNELRLGLFAGELADFRLWTVARSDDDIRGSMYLTLSNNTPSLAVNYLFIEAGGIYAHNAGTAGSALDGLLVNDGSTNEIDPIWVASTNDLDLATMRIPRITAGSNVWLQLPAYDAESGLNLTYTNITLVGATFTNLLNGRSVVNGLLPFTAPTGYEGLVTLTYWVADTAFWLSPTNATHLVSGTVTLLIINSHNQPPIISSIANVTSVENTPFVEIPFTVSDDQPLSQLTITPVAFGNKGLLQPLATTNVIGQGSFRLLRFYPQPDQIGSVQVQVLVKDAYDASTSTTFALRIEPAPTYSVIDLGLLPGKAASFGTGVNEAGAVVGYCADTAAGQNPVGFLYKGLLNGGDLQAIQLGSGTINRPAGLNNLFTVVGEGNLAAGGQMEGFVRDLDGLWAGVVRSSQDFASPPSGFRALTDGEVWYQAILAGYGTAANGNRQAVMASAEATTPMLQSLGGLAASSTNASEAFAIQKNSNRDLGLPQIVGSAYDNLGGKRAFVWQGSSLGMMPLLSLANDSNSVAYAINNFGQVAGVASGFMAGDSAVAFGGGNASVACSNLLYNTNGTSLPAANSDHTIEAWVRVDGVPASGTTASVLWLGNGNHPHHWQVANVNGGPAIRVGIVNGGVFPAVPVALGRWAHVAVVYSAASSNLTVYLNGLAVTNCVANNCNLAGIPLYLGRGTDAEAAFIGALDEVRIWKGTRPPADVLANFNQRLTGQEADLVVYFPFDEAQGMNGVSAAAGNLTGAMSLVTWIMRAGEPSPAITIADSTLQLDGVGGYALATNSTALAVTGNITVEAWIKPAVTNATMGIVDKAGYVPGSYGGYSLTVQPDGRVKFSTQQTNGASLSVISQTAVSPKVWTHVAGIWHDGSVLTPQLAVFINGVLDNSTADPGAAQGPQAGTNALLLGNAGRTREQSFNGALGTVRIWNTAHFASDLQALMNLQLSGGEATLVACFSLDEGRGAFTQNRVPHQPSAVLMGTATWAARDDGQTRAFLYDPATATIRSLGILAGGYSSEAHALNDYGQVAGTVSAVDGTHAFLYSANQVNDLASLLPETQVNSWRLQSASGINSSGAIVGTGTSNGQTRAFLALPGTAIGRPVLAPLGAADRLPDIAILRQNMPDDNVANSFYWCGVNNRLYAIRPVTARLDWYTGTDSMQVTNVILGMTNVVTVPNTNRITTITVNVWPKNPTLHISGAPVDLEPDITAAHYSFQSLMFVTNLASVQPSTKLFTCASPGYTVLFYLNNEGQQPNPQTQTPWFEVVRTVAYDDTAHAGLTSASWRIGTEITNAAHTEYNSKNGYVLREKAAYDGAGADRAYDRGARQGPILPVNVENPTGKGDANPDPLIVVWYRTNRIGVAWASLPVQYQLQWDTNAPAIVIADTRGSGPLDAGLYPEKVIYNQPDPSLPGFNPNEEHALLPGDTLYALRNDLNTINNFSQPYVLLKYRNPGTGRWQMQSYRVVAEQPPSVFAYTGTAGKEVQPPLPLSLLNLCGQSNRVVAGPGWKDYQGKIYAQSAGPEGGPTNLAIQWFYPLQPGFYYPDTNVAVGAPVAWLDRHPSRQLVSPNDSVGVPGQPIQVSYLIRWGQAPVLQVGQTLLHANNGLPSVFDWARGQILYDDLHPTTATDINSLARFYDPLSARTLKTNLLALPGLNDPKQTQTVDGKVYFTRLPWHLRVRLFYDPVNNWLSFQGYYNAANFVGQPLLMPNVLSSRERDRVKQLSDPAGTAWAAHIVTAWDKTVDNLYDLTRNPNGVDLDHDGKADQALRVGLVPQYTVQLSNNTVYTTVYPTDSSLHAVATNVVPESLGAGPKALTTALGGVAAAQPEPGNALSLSGTNGWVSLTAGPNGDLGPLANSSFTVEFWAKANGPMAEQYVVSQAGGSGPLNTLRIGFRPIGTDPGFAFDLGLGADGLFAVRGSYNDTNWHHWACTFDSSTRVQSVYRDGMLQGTNTLAGMFLGAGTIELGRCGSGGYFAGQLDEVRVWSTARSASNLAEVMNKRLLGSETNLLVYLRCDEPAGTATNSALATAAGYAGTLHSVSRVISTAPTGIPPRYLTLVENNDASLGGLPVALHVIRIDDGPFIGDLKVLPGDNIFDERLTFRHSSDFGGDPGPLTFQWWYKPIAADFDPTDLPLVDPTDVTGSTFSDMRGWTKYLSYSPLDAKGDGPGVNYITTGEGGESGLISLCDNAFLCRYKGYGVNLYSSNTWSGWIGDPNGTPDQPRALVAEGWVKRVVRGLNPFDARTADFHSSAVDTYTSMLIEAGHRYEGDIAFNPSADAINGVGLIEAYQTVLNRAESLSINGVPAVDFDPANNALLLAATKLSDLYVLLGNEAYADAQDPTIGFSTDSGEYGSMATSIFAFENQLDSLLEEELCLLRGRDDSAAGVSAAPVYNRLYWNFTLGEGEVAYRQVYNITDQNNDGFIDETDARILFPQGHGDAWGHYLTALEEHYALLRHPYFTWVPRSEFVDVGGTAVKVDFLDERKFATAAALKAKVGLEIMDRTYRENYVDDPAGQWQGYKDADTDRAWGVAEWAWRAGEGAYLDWVTANAILPAVDPDPSHAGIDKIDRTTVLELGEIARQADDLQARIDQADAGLNPLGLAKGVVPFDIDPSFLDVGSVIQGQTHFEQIEARAVKAMNNAAAVWDQANKSSSMLRQNQDAAEKFSANVDDQERDYKNRLIEIFGYPYAGDTGPGNTYPSGYDGPDLVHFMYVPTSELNGQTAPASTNFTAFFTTRDYGINHSQTVAAGAFHSSQSDFFFPSDYPGGEEMTDRLASDILTVNYPMSGSGYGFTAPASWGARRAPGDIQMALSDAIQQQARLKQALLNYDNLLKQVEDSIAAIDDQYQLRADDLQITYGLWNTKIGIGSAIFALKVVAKGIDDATSTVDKMSDCVCEYLPKVVGLAMDVTSPARGAAKTASTISDTILTVVKDAADLSQEGLSFGQEQAEEAANLAIEKNQFKVEIQERIRALEDLMRQEAGLRVEIFNQEQALQQGIGRYQAAVAGGQRLLDERIAFRKKVSAQVTQSRYQDMTFRIFRNDALQKYRAQFDLAARYVYLAATAYDYEVNLLGSDNQSGSAFLTDIIRQRSLGQMVDDSPVAGQPGLADPLGRLSQNFDVLKTQLGFNNPQTETGRFSIRSELFRIHSDAATNSLGVASGTNWHATLQSCRVANLWALPEFRRYCRPFAPESAGAQPGLVIRFPTTVTFGYNFFGWPLGGGDSAYDSSRFATKIRSIGVWLTGYDSTAMSLTPRVYLVPVGMDVLRSPSGDGMSTRRWRVVDQCLPVPYPIGASSFTDPSWIPMDDSLGGSFADLRHHAGFRAYPDSGEFDPSQAISDSRLIGRSVWNTDWMLIIPGGSLLNDPAAGLDAFVNSVSDIKIFFQTYSYPGN